MFQSSLVLFAVVLAVAVHQAHGYTQEAVNDCMGPTTNGDIITCSKILVGTGRPDDEFTACAAKTNDPATINEAKALLDCLNGR